jgi:Bacterial alpha-L-rhamnosidase C-terminal domain
LQKPGRSPSDASAFYFLVCRNPSAITVVSMFERSTEITEAHGSFEAVTGHIAVAWKIADGNFILDATLPPNTTGTVQMPSGQIYEIGSGAYRYQEPFKTAN